MGERRWLKLIADSLTILRLLIALMLPAVGAIYGQGAISGLAGWLFVAAWLTDTFDGQLARRSGLAGSGICGKLDPWADLLLALGGFTTLYVVGLFSPWVLVAVLVAVAVGCSIDFLVFQGLFAFSLIVTYLVFATRQSLEYLIVCLSLMAVGLIVFRQRFITLCRRFLGHIGKRYL